MLARSGRSGPHGQVRHQRTRRIAAAGQLYRSSHSGDHAGDLRFPPPRPGHGWPIVYGQGHARALHAGPAHRAAGSGRQRRRDSDSARRWRDTRTGRLARHSRLQPRPEKRIGRWHRPDGVTKPAGGWWPSIQPAERRPRRNECHSLGGGQGQPAAPEAQLGRQTSAAHDGSAGGHNASPGLHPAVCEGSASRGGHGGDSPRRPQTCRRSAGWRRQALLGADQLGLRPGDRDR